MTNKLSEVNEEYHQNIGALEASQKQIDLLETKNAELVNDKVPHLQSEVNELQTNYDMLLSYSNVCYLLLFLFFILLQSTLFLFCCACTYVRLWSSSK